MASNSILQLKTWINTILSHVSAAEILDFAYNAPKYYLIWWNRLYKETPEHVYIETALVLFILWLVFIRKTIDPKKTDKKDKFTENEVKSLIETWYPEPLVPRLTPLQTKLNQLTPIIDKYEGNKVIIRGLDRPVLQLSSFDFLGLITSILWSFS